MGKIRNALSNLSSRAKGVIAATGTCVITAATSAMTACAAVPEEMKQSLDTAFTTVKSDVISFMSSSLPAALAIMGISLAITLGIRFFKKFAN